MDTGEQRAGLDAELALGAEAAAAGRPCAWRIWTRLLSSAQSYQLSQSCVIVSVCRIRSAGGPNVVGSVENGMSRIKGKQ